jgi:hypothetical protein
MKTTEGEGGGFSAGLLFGAIRAQGSLKFIRKAWDE